MAASADALFQEMVTNNVTLPVAAATTIYKGAMVSLVDGNLVNLTDGLRFTGHATAQVVNTTAAGYGTAGQLKCTVRTGKYILHSLAISNVSALFVGAIVYAVDNNTYTLAPMGTPVGRIFQFVSSGYADIEFDTAMSRDNMGAGLRGHFMPFFKNINDGCVEANNSGVAKEWIRTSVNGAGIIRCLQNAAALTTPYFNGLQIIPDTADNDSEELQMSGELFYLSSTGKPCVFGTRIAVPDADQTDTIIGLCITDSTILAGNTDGITFRAVDASAETKLYIEKNDTETASANLVTRTDNGIVSLAWIYTGDAVIPYINGVATTSQAVTNLPNDEGLTITIAHTAGATTDGGLIVYYLDAYQIV